MQKYLKNPVILHSEDILNEFKPKLDFVINKFYIIEQERLKLRGQANNSKAQVEQKMDIVVGSEEKSEYHPGFLKSRQLFDLQVHTPTAYGTNEKDGRFEIPSNSLIPNHGSNEASPFPHSGGKRKA